MQPVFVSDSFGAVLRPIAMYLDVVHSLNVRMSVAADGFLTGDIEFPQTIGAGKATAVRQFLGDHLVDPMLCYAFGDEKSDLQMLRTVGRPAVVGHELAAYAQQRNWEILVAD